VRFTYWGPNITEGDPMYLGIDLGTSEIKIVLMEETGHIVATARRALHLSRPHARWSEQSPDEWWLETLKAIDRLEQTHPAKLKAVRGIGLSGQMHGAVLLDAADRPLRPAILWNDARSDIQCRTLISRAPFLREVTRNAAMPRRKLSAIIWICVP